MRWIKARPFQAVILNLVETEEEDVAQDPVIWTIIGAFTIFGIVLAAVALYARTE